jgi:hypothetical protein
VLSGGLEEKLGFGDLAVPGAYPLTPEQARIALSSFAGSDVDDLMSRGQGLEFFLAEYGDE